MSIKSSIQHSRPPLQKTTSIDSMSKAQSNPLGLEAKKGHSRSRSMPDLTKTQFVGTTTPTQHVGLESKSGPNNKRIQVMQLQVKIDGDQQLPNSEQNLRRKAEAAFNAFELVHTQHLSDARKGTAKVYSLPEFYWSQYGDALTPEEHDFTLAQIQELAANPDFENAVFVLGTMVTARRPESLLQIEQGDLATLNQKLGGDFSEAYQEATSKADEA